MKSKCLKLYLKIYNEKDQKVSDVLANDLPKYRIQFRKRINNLKVGYTYKTNI